MDKLAHSLESGLSQSEVIKRLEQYGSNSLPDAKTPSIFAVFFRQFFSPLIFILVFASIVIFLMGEPWDSVVILVVLVFNAVVGTIQEGKAQNALNSLRKFAEGSATVLREGKISIINDREVVPGDILILQEGEKVPADSKLVTSHFLEIDESMLTGESVPVKKDSQEENKSLIFKGSTIVSGNGRAEVLTTGVLTKIGQISQKIATIDTDVPLKKSIDKLSINLIYAVFLLSVFIFLIGTLRGENLVNMFATVVSLSVSIIPEGLPVVLTLVLATGVWRMAKKNVLVKRLQAVEALGRAKIIAVDKTGTLTENQMTLQKVYVDGKIYDVGGLGYEPKGGFLLEGNSVEPVNHPDLVLAGRIASFSSDATAIYIEDSKIWKVSGDPTEAAIAVFAEKVGFKDTDLESEKIFELPFNHDNKYHLTIRKFEGKNFLSLVGAPESVISKCGRVWRKQRSEKFEEEEKKSIEEKLTDFSRKGFRIIAAAFNHDSGDNVDQKDLPDLVFAGFFAIRDPLRPNVRDEVMMAKNAGIRTVMITGDHKITAHAIAVEAGIAGEKERILTGPEIDRLSDAELSDLFPRIDVFARVTPDHKLRIIDLWRKRGDIVAMTGDGVNDAPSLAAADLGVAMGVRGTEVAKDAADIVLLDDNIKSIISAVEEGRSIYNTIKKVILYLFSTSVGEALAIVGAILLGLPLPVLPTQIIWLNFVTDGFLVLALAAEPKEKGLLSKGFKQSTSLVDMNSFFRMFFMGFVIAASSLLVFAMFLNDGIEKALTVSLCALAASQWFNAWNCRSESESVFSRSISPNKYLVFATILIIFFQLFAVYNSFMQKVLHTISIGYFEWVVVIIAASSVMVFEEIRKALIRPER